MTLFDTHVIVDWSASKKKSREKPIANSIWWAAIRSGDAKCTNYVRTRQQAVEDLTTFIAGELDEGRSVLAGFDFPFGYPDGTARRLTGRNSALALWDWLSERICDRDNNWNNRVEVAEEINSLFPGIGPFWGWRPGNDMPGVPKTRKDRPWSQQHPPEFRIAESRTERAKPVWQLFGNGSVGSQTLVGLPAVKRLISDPRIKGHTRVWPFETGLQVPEEEGKLVVVEVYPSLLKDEISRCTDDIKDRAQVRVLARGFANLDSGGELGRLFEGPQDLTSSERSLIETEGGMDSRAKLRGSA